MHNGGAMVAHEDQEHHIQDNDDQEHNVSVNDFEHQEHAQNNNNDSMFY